jgi:fermentation-respiration switch protein FrsA (DUF1100 family)
MRHRSFSRFVLTIAVSYSFMIGLLFLAQRHMIYPAPYAKIVTPDIPGLESTTITASDGVKIAAWYVAPMPGRPVIVYFHGNGEQLSFIVDRFRNFAKQGYGLVAIDYRGYGASEGNPTERGLLADGMAAYKFAADRHGEERIVTWGYSLGTGVAVAVAAEKNVAAVILEAAYSSTVDVAADRIWFAPIRLLMLDTFRSDIRIKSVRAPILFMHGDEDETIPISYGRRLFSLANEPKAFKLLSGADHYYLDNFGASDEAFKFIDESTQK